MKELLEYREKLTARLSKATKEFCEACESFENPFEKVEIILDEYIKKVLENQSFYKILLCEQVMKKSPEVIQLLKSLKLGYAGMFAELVKEGQKKKIFKTGLNGLVCADIFFVDLDVFCGIPSNWHQSFFIAFTDHADKVYIQVQTGNF